MKVKGDIAENKATNFLLSNDYIIIKRNYKISLGEIDIIAKKNNILIAVEVKYRKNVDMLFESIKPLQKRRIINAFNYFIKEHSEYQQCFVRIDAIFINKEDIHHIQNAWGDDF